MYANHFLTGQVTKPETHIGHRHHRPGSVFDYAIERVCGPCNNGWMSRAEADIRPILEPMIKGTGLELTEADRSKLARYITYKFLLVDWGQRRPMLPPEIAHAFHRDGTMPSNLTINLCNCDEGNWRAAMLVVEIPLYRNEEFPGLDAPANTKSFALGMGNAYFLVTYAGSSQLELEFHPGSAIPIWPLEAGLRRWPPLFAISSEQADANAHVLRTLTSHPNVTLIDPI